MDQAILAPGKQAKDENASQSFPIFIHPQAYGWPTWPACPRPRRHTNKMPRQLFLKRYAGGSLVGSESPDSANK